MVVGLKAACFLLTADRSTMLLSLSISDYVLVDRLDMALEPGFSVLTGETGAGKSILLDALHLALGERGDAGVVREGCERAEISALFSLADAQGLSDWLEENGLEGDEDQCLLRRSIDSGGRSRAFINGRPATLAQLKTAGEFLVDIHGQHAHYSLLRPGVQREMLDAYSGTRPLGRQVAAAFRAWQGAERSLADASRLASEHVAERERLQWQVEELERLAFSPDDWERVQEEHRRLAHAAELLQGTQAVVAGLEADEQGGLAILASLGARLAELAEIDPGLTPVRELMDSSLVQAQESARELAHYAERLDLDPETLAQLEVRIAQINDAARKYRVRPEALPGLLEEGRRHLAEMARLADMEALRLEAEQAKAAYQSLADALSRGRHKGAKSLAKAVSAALQRLAMQGGCLEVELEPCPAEAGGLEKVEFLIAPHAAQTLKPLAKTASGGELSRIGLALQTVMSSISGAPSLIFDEVDAGIGGGVGEIVGRMLADLGRERQVLCVTHLPQVAARAGHHWQVVKNVAKGKTLTRAVSLDAMARVEEVARMLGGVELTETTRRHAAEMLGPGDGERGNGKRKT
jgi:DNA repair protein RecN (Recombination protein N)